MKKKQPHKIILIGISIVVTAVSILCLSFVYQSTKNRLLDDKLKSGKREVREIGKLLEAQLKSGLSKEKVIKNLQKSIVNTDIGLDFICMYNTEGVELCHPNPAFIGREIAKNDSYIKHLDSRKNSSFLAILQSGKSTSGIRNFSNKRDRDAEIVNVFPVAGTNWMVASHINIPALQTQLSGLYYKFLVIFLICILTIIVLSYILIRVLYRRYEQFVNKEIDGLNEEVNLLNALNHQLVKSQNETQNKIHSEPATQEIGKKRIVTYQKDKVVTIKTNDLAYAYIENGGTYIRTFSNDNYPVNGSLDELMTQLDTTDFYRVNRQLIVNINAIQTIYIYGKNQLKLVTQPSFKEIILISKNKAASFKKWLDR